MITFRVVNNQNRHILILWQMFLIVALSFTLLFESQIERTCLVVETFTRFVYMYKKS